MSVDGVPVEASNQGPQGLGEPPPGGQFRAGYPTEAKNLETFWSAEAAKNILSAHEEVKRRKLEDEQKARSTMPSEPRSIPLPDSTADAVPGVEKTPQEGKTENPESFDPTKIKDAIGALRHDVNSLGVTVGGLVDKNKTEDDLAQARELLGEEQGSEGSNPTDSPQSNIDTNPTPSRSPVTAMGEHVEGEKPFSTKDALEYFVNVTPDVIEWKPGGENTRPMTAKDIERVNDNWDTFIDLHSQDGNLELWELASEYPALQKQLHRRDQVYRARQQAQTQEEKPTMEEPVEKTAEKPTQQAQVEVATPPTAETQAEAPVVEPEVIAPSTEVEEAEPVVEEDVGDGAPKDGVEVEAAADQADKKTSPTVAPAKKQVEPQVDEKRPGFWRRIFRREKEDQADYAHRYAYGNKYGDNELRTNEDIDESGRDRRYYPQQKNSVTTADPVRGDGVPEGTKRVTHYWGVSRDDPVFGSGRITDIETNLYKDFPRAKGAKAEPVVDDTKKEPATVDATVTPPEPPISPPGPGSSATGKVVGAPAPESITVDPLTGEPVTSPADNGADAAKLAEQQTAKNREEAKRVIDELDRWINVDIRNRSRIGGGSGVKRMFEQSSEQNRLAREYLDNYASGDLKVSLEGVIEEDQKHFEKERGELIGDELKGKRITFGGVDVPLDQAQELLDRLKDLSQSK